MNKIYLVNLETLYQILNELSDLIQYEIISVNKKNILTIENDKNFNINNSIFLVNNKDILKNSRILVSKNYLVLEKIPIQIFKLIEKLNILFLKKIYKDNSNFYLDKYIININNKQIFKDNISLKLTEKELEIIKFLNLKKNYPQNVQVLQNEIWKYGKNLETHTVETHIYRLRKKIVEKFNDTNFIKSSKSGYYL